MGNKQQREFPVQDYTIPVDFRKLRCDWERSTYIDWVRAFSKDWPIVIVDIRKFDHLTSDEIATILAIARAKKLAVLATDSVLFTLKAICAQSVLSMYHGEDELQKALISNKNLQSPQIVAKVA